MTQFRIFDSKRAKPLERIYPDIQECIKGWTLSPEGCYVEASSDGETWNPWTLESIKREVGALLNQSPDSGGVRSHNVGASDYSKHKIQPWDIWIEYKLNPWDADIVKRVLRSKSTDSRRLDYEKIIHICQERIRHIDEGIDI